MRSLRRVESEFCRCEPICKPNANQPPWLHQREQWTHRKCESQSRHLEGEDEEEEIFFFNKYGVEEKRRRRTNVFGCSWRGHCLGDIRQMIQAYSCFRAVRKKKKIKIWNQHTRQTKEQWNKNNNSLANSLFPLVPTFFFSIFFRNFLVICCNALIEWQNSIDHTIDKLIHQWRWKNKQRSQSPRFHDAPISRSDASTSRDTI